MKVLFEKTELVSLDGVHQALWKAIHAARGHADRRAIPRSQVQHQAPVSLPRVDRVPKPAAAGGGHHGDD